MADTHENTPAEQQVCYTDHFTRWCEMEWGAGFLSPGGRDEVAKVVEGLDLTDKEVLDIGVGLAGPACVLAAEHGAARVIGIDIEGPVLERAAETVRRHGLGDRVVLKRVAPGPLPFADGSFDLVFSKDAIIHIPDTAALFRDAYRVLRPGGWIAISDWYCGDQPFSAEMTAWVERLDLGLAMKPAETDRRRLEDAGFVDVAAVDRNAWYAADAARLVEHLRGPGFAAYAEALGEDDARDGVKFAQERATHAASGELRPGHLRGRKPGAGG